MKRYDPPARIWILLAAACLFSLTCNLGNTTASEDELGDIEVSETSETVEPIPADTSEPETTPTTITPPDDIHRELIQPEDLLYLGAFRLPETSDDYGWGYSGYAMTYFPEGDPHGSDDGFPGSLFILGHDHTQYVSEVSIPAPVISEAKNPNELLTATTLQPFRDIRGGMFGELEIPRAGLAYLPPQDSQTTAKLYFCWGQHFQFDREPSHGWSELDFSVPNPAGPWYVGEYSNYATCDYLFEIPARWAETYTPGLRLATGRFRDGSWGGLGPALFAIGPWNEGEPPLPNSTLQQVIPLLLYGNPVPGNPEIDISQGHRMNTYSEPDEWSGGAWLTNGEKSALIFIGTKAIGRSWYGFSNGVEYPISGDPDEEYPEVPPWPHDDRGWWSDDISAQILFYNPSELGMVARGEMKTWESQPYATLTLDNYLFDPGFDYERYKRYLLGAAAYDRDRGLLYIVERLAEEDDRSLIHVFRLET